MRNTCFSLNFVERLWYNDVVALLIPGNGKEVHTLETMLSLACSIAANVIAYYICKWLDEQSRDN